MVRRWLFMALIASSALLAAAACSELEECSDDADCASGYACIRSRSGWVTAGYCAPQESSLSDVPGSEMLDPGCALICTGEQDVPGAVCDPSGVICALTCSSLADSRADCDGELATGCETRLDSDPAHCGACNNDCGQVLAARGATGTCVAGVCVPTGCLESEGWFALDGQADDGDGCELHIGLDAMVEHKLEDAFTIMRVARPWPGLSVVYELGGNVGKVIRWYDDGEREQMASIGGQERLFLDLRSAPQVDAGADRAFSFLAVEESSVLLGYRGLEAINIGSQSRDALAADLTSSLRAIGGLPSHVDFFEVSDSVLRWYELLPNDATPAGDKSENCVTSQQADLRLCRIDEEPLPGSAGANSTLVRVVHGTEHVYVLVSRDARFDSFRLDLGAGEIVPLAAAPGSDSVESCVDLVPWQQQHEGQGFAVLSEQGDVRFYRQVPTFGTNEVLRRLEKEIPVSGLEPQPFMPHSLVPLGNNRYALAAENGLYILSSHADEPNVVYVQPGGRAGWLSAARAPRDDSSIAIAQPRGLFLLPLTIVGN